MSVNTSEEYLDELLQAIEPIIYKNEPAPMVDDQAYASTEQVENQLENVNTEPRITESSDLEDATAGLEMAGDFAVSDALETADSISLDNLVSDDSISLENLVAEAAEDTVSEDGTDTEVSMDDLLAALTSEENAEVEEMDVDAMLSAAAGAVATDTYDPTVHDNDVKELLKQFSDDEDLSDIGEILDRDDKSEAVDESVLLTPDVEVFQLEETPEEEEENEPVKEKKGLFSRFKKKNKKKKKNQSVETEEAIPSNHATVELEDEGTVDLLMPEETVHADLTPRADVSVETEAMDAMDIGSLMNLGDTEMLSAGGDELDLGNLFGDGDMADIDQLLAAGSFEEIGTEELLRDKTDNKADAGKDGKKGSFFSRFINMLLEEDEEEEEKEPKKAKKGNVPEADATGVTDENLGILDELSKEDKKKAKKEKKEQKKKEKEAKKKGKAVTEGAEGDQENEEGTEGDDKKKKKKVKKEKPRKVVDIDQKPEKKLSRKKVSIVFLYCFSILAIILLFKNVVLDLSNLKEARWAFDNADYATCYANLYGEELSEEDEAIFQKSYVILCVQRKWDSYENFMQMDMGVEALNALFDGVRVYRNMEQRAGELGIVDRIAGIYQTIYSKLGEYGLSNEEIEEILDYDSKVTYTKRLESIVNGTPFEEVEDLLEEEVQEVTEPKPLEDVLPQEEDFLPEDTSTITVAEPVAIQEEPQTTVVVGSSPVDVSTDNAGGNIGVNVGNGDTNVSATVNGDNVVVF